MPLNIRRLRLWILLSACALLAVVAGFFVYGQLKAYRALKRLPQKLGVDIQQSAQGFTFSKSERGHTLFTVHAGKLTQFKQGGHAALSDVKITVYGKQAGSYDEISGNDFEYDPQAQTVRANGDVSIDLHGAAPASPQGTNTLHVKTSGLVFNQQSGMARTDALIEFDAAQARGSARGALYDSHTQQLTLQSAVHIESSNPKTGAVQLDAGQADITGQPRAVVLKDATGRRGGDTFRA